MKADHTAMISHRAFWIGLAVYAVFCLLGVTAFASASTDRNFNYSGTIIFGGARQPETTTIDRPNFSQNRGAVTLRSDWSSRAALTERRLIDATFRADLFSMDLPDSTFRSVGSPGGVQQTFSEMAGGMSALQIAMGDENWIDGNITPVPESPTWLGASLVAGSVGWSQRRRFARKFRR